MSLSPQVLAASISYFIAATLFLLGLQRMASPVTARSGIQWAGAGMVLATAATFLLPGLHNLALMIVVFKVAAMLTRSWRLGRAASAPTMAYAGSVSGGHQERPLMAAPAAAPAAAAIASDRVRSTVASIETMSSVHRVGYASTLQPALPAPAPQLAAASPQDARSQLRYLHHRVGGASSNNSSRDFLR